MKYICVFCGSSMGVKPAYKQAAIALGKALARRKLGLVYGGGNVGLMGTVADGCLAAGGEVLGVIPDFLVAKEIAHTGLTQLHIVKSMHERKTMMAQLSDAFVALPGGYGTLEEFCEILTWAQLGLHQKPFALLNIKGYYDSLLKFFDQAVTEEFLRPIHRSLVLEASEPENLLDLLANYQPQNVDKWIRKDVKP
ncbi:TIGR00730 family Rossman fold protein [Brasilonema sp. UFV-L1]|uniref:LOG family protein n=1 Tax=Brasilonema sp. UFV-L1 TaxID=2234130 RepID=UPI00145D74A0|nr:TIGR00730 family Rossman fold protein [Brasilonema sp. UFV-L1]NMG08177.1 TIGR00730 family Rossman fold protein [Brasilonema sp. UFV-L1]